MGEGTDTQARRQRVRMGVQAATGVDRSFRGKEGQCGH